MERLVTSRAQQLPSRGKGGSGKGDLDDVAGNELYYRIEERERRRCAHNDREPRPTAKHDDNRAYSHRGGGGKEATIPSVLSERAGNKRRRRERYQVATAWS